MLSKSIRLRKERRFRAEWKAESVSGQHWSQDRFLKKQEQQQEFLTPPKIIRITNGQKENSDAEEEHCENEYVQLEEPNNLTRWIKQVDVELSLNLKQTAII